MSQYLFVAFVQFLLCLNLVGADFSCNLGPNSCPDLGEQLISNGGNVVVHLISARHLPDTDGFGFNAGQPDVFVQFIWEDNPLSRSSTKFNNIKPEWHEDVTLGYLTSGSLISVNVMDEDLGLELSNDVMATGTFRVPYCSTFYANESDVGCPEYYNCQSTDSLWPMPVRQVCSEEGTIELTGGSVLNVIINVIPFVAEVTRKNDVIGRAVPKLSVAGRKSEFEGSNDFNEPFGDLAMEIDMTTNFQQISNLFGALIVQTFQNDKDQNVGSYYDVLTNFPAKIFICRHKADNERGVPEWLLNAYDSREKLINQFNLVTTGATGGDNEFHCFSKHVEGTSRNKWGGVQSGTIVLGTNTVRRVSSYLFNYIVMLQPERQNKVPASYLVPFDRPAFWQLFAQFGIMFLVYLWIWTNFMKKIKFRLNGIDAYLLSKVFSGEEKTILSLMFISYAQTPENIEFRSHLYHCSNGILLCICLPSIALFSWGISTVSVVKPPAVGFFMSFVGTGMMIFYYSFQNWKNQKWRMDIFSLIGILVFLLTVLIFFLSCVFTDPLVWYGHQNLDFSALSMSFAFVNVIPMILLAFQQDRSFSENIETLRKHITIAGLAVKATGEDANAKQDGSFVPPSLSDIIQSENSFGKSGRPLDMVSGINQLLGDMYSVSTDIPSLKYSAVFLSSDMTDEDNASKKKFFFGLFESRLRFMGTFVLFVYLMIASSRTDYGKLAFLNCCGIILVDFIHDAVSRSNQQWSPGYAIALLVLGRIFIMGGGISYWLAGYAVAYIVYGLALIEQAIARRLPKMTLEESGKIAFFGKFPVFPAQLDISVNVEFMFALLTFCFAGLSLIASYSPTDALHNTTLVVGGTDWNLSFIGVVAIVFVFISGLVMATIRSNYLDEQGLLRDWAAEAYLFTEDTRLPTIFAALTQVALIAFGMIVMGETGGSWVLICTLFLPAILCLWMMCFSEWVRNDYSLICWPPKEEKPVLVDSTPTDLEVAFNLIDNLFHPNIGPSVGKDQMHEDSDSDENDKSENETDGDSDEERLSQEKKQEKDKKKEKKSKSVTKFNLPPLVKPSEDLGEIKLPSLPLKSILRKRRQQASSAATSKGGSSSKLSSHFSTNAMKNNEDDDGVDNIELAKTEEVKDPVQSTSMSRQKSNLSAGKKSSTKKKPVIENRSEKKESSRSSKIDKKNRPLTPARKRKPKEKKMRIGWREKMPKWDDIRVWLEKRKLGKLVLNCLSVLNRNVGFAKSKFKYTTVTVKAMEPDAEQPVEIQADAVVAVEVVEEKKEIITNPITEKKPVDFKSMHFWKAAVEGYLLKDEYMLLLSWFGSLLLLLIFGCVIGGTQNPTWLGHVIWAGSFIAIFAVIPIVKYVNTFKVDHTIIEFAVADFFVYFIFCFAFFFGPLGGRVNGAASLWLLDFFIYYPICMYLFISLVLWADNGWRLEVLDKDGDGKISGRELLDYLKGSPVFVSLGIIFIWQLYMWGNSFVGSIGLLIFICGLFGFLFLRDWARNDFYMSPEYRALANFASLFAMFVVGCIALMGSGAPLFSLSLLFFIHICRCMSFVLLKFLSKNKSQSYFFSPFVLPFFVYDPFSQDLQDDSRVAIQLFSAIGGGLLWGIVLATFLSPVSYGVGAGSVIGMSIAVCVASCITHIPNKLSSSALLLDAMSVIDPVKVVREKFIERQKPFEIVCPDSNPEDAKKKPVTKTAKSEKKVGPGSNPKKTGIEAEIEELKKLVGEDSVVEASKQPVYESQIVMQEKSVDPTIVGLASMSVTGLCMNILDKFRSLRYLKDERAIADKQIEMQREKQIKLHQKEGEEDNSGFDIIGATKSILSRVRRFLSLLPSSFLDNYRTHSQAMLRPNDALAESLVTGRGPLGFLGVDGQFYKLFQYIKTKPRLSFLDQPWLNPYDKNGNRTNSIPVAQMIDSWQTILDISSIQDIVDNRFYEEFRCGAHFLVMLVASAEAKLIREQILFQRFFREYRFRLMSNGISPPPNIFASASYSSIDVPLVAVWLATLSEEERERFHMLKASFAQEQSERDSMIETEDTTRTEDAEVLAKTRSEVIAEASRRLYDEMRRWEAGKLVSWSASLNEYDLLRWNQVKALWLSRPFPYVHQEDRDLFESFRKNIRPSDPLKEYCQEKLEQIDSGQRDCQLGKFGRELQFTDPDFPPDEVSIGRVSRIRDISDWQVSIGINSNVKLFDAGTDPDDVEQGILLDGWLLSAISMLAAAAGIGDGDVDQQIANLFIPRKKVVTEAAGEESDAIKAELDHKEAVASYSTWTGAYCVRLFMGGQWIPVVIDDYLPILKDELVTSTNRGVAFGHSKGCTELWVSLIEKAYAKFLGSYGSLEKGFVQHALHELTGCEGQEISVSSISRGPRKKSLWRQMIQFKKNGYILGAAAVSPKFADQDIIDSGIAFGAAYTIYEVIEVDGIKVIRLRNPPGHKLEWKGDWGDKSELWTHRMKHKLKWEDDADDNTFWMSFDDFCHVYRSLYICRWHNPSKWSNYTFFGKWKMQSEDVTLESSKGETDSKEKTAQQADDAERSADAACETAAGLPHKGNPGCQIEKNPQYSLIINRPTELRISLSQTDSRGMSPPTILPVTFFVVSSPDTSRPSLIKSLTKDNVVISSGDAECKRTQHLYVTLEPGIYMVLCGTFDPEMEGPFTLTVLSNYPCRVNQFWPPSYAVSMNQLEDFGSDFLKSVAVPFLQRSIMWAQGIANKGKAEEEVEVADVEKQDEEAPKPKDESQEAVQGRLNSAGYKFSEKAFIDPRKKK